MALGYQNPFYLKQAQKKQQSLYDGKVLLEKHDPPAVHDSKETLQLAKESREKIKQLNKEIKPANYTKIDHLSGGFVPQTAMSHEELYFLNNSKTANVSKSISIPNEDFLDDTTPSVARKFLNKVKSTIVTLQRVVKHIMTIKTHNWSSSAHQDLHKIEAAKFVGDFKPLANEADASLAKHKALELEIERLLKVVISQDIMNIVPKESVVDTSDLQTELERTKEHFENCIIKKENEYAKLWNDWYKKCDECKYDKISYDKTYKDMQQKIERLQAQFGDLKGKCKDTSCVSDTQNPLSQKLENENVELEFQVSDQKDNTCDMSKNTKFAKQPIVENLPKVGESHALSKPFTSNSVSTPQESKVMNNDKVIAPGMFRINPSKTSREEKHVPNNTTLLKPEEHSPRAVQRTISINSRGKKQNANVSNVANQKKHKAQLWKPKNVGSKERLASPKPSSPRSCFRWSPTERFFELKGKIIASNESKSQSDCSIGDNACSSNPLEPISKRFPNSTFSMTGELFGISGKLNVSQMISQDTLIDFIKLFYGSAWQYIKDRPTVDSLGVIRQLRIRRWRYNLILAESKFKTPCSIIKDKYMMKAQVHVSNSNSSAISDVQALPQRKHYCQNDKSIKCGKVYVEGKIVSKLSRSLSMRAVTQDRKAA
nr:hypothetical protein [Tanacetum cinerariifolium]